MTNAIHVVVEVRGRDSRHEFQFTPREGHRFHLLQDCTPTGTNEKADVSLSSDSAEHPILRVDTEIKLLYCTYKEPQKWGAMRRMGRYMRAAEGITRATVRSAQSRDWLDCQTVSDQVTFNKPTAEALCSLPLPLSPRSLSGAGLRAVL